MTTKQPWRQEIELLQNYSKHKSFTYTTTSADAETAVDVDGSHGIVAGDVLLIDSEYMTVESVSTNTLTVTRGAYDSEAGNHNDDTAVMNAFKFSVPVNNSGAAGTNGVVRTKVPDYSDQTVSLDLLDTLCKLPEHLMLH